MSKNPLCVLLCASLISAHAAAATFTVVNTNDGGAGSLRQAILDGVAATVGSAAHDTVIAFNIPGAGVHTIRPTSSLPAIKDLLIDGYTQPGSRANTLAVGSDAVLNIEIDGTFAGAGANGLVNLGAAPGTGVPTVTIRGLVINRFGGSGIRVTGPGGAGFPGFAIIEGNFIGTDATGTEARGNGIGIELGIDGQTIIGEQTPALGGNTLPFPAHRNLISGNVGAGIKFDSPDPHEPALGTVRGAYIGTDAQGLAPLGNGGDGVFFGPEAGVGSQDFGSFVYLYDNVIAANAGDGLDAQSVGTQAVNNTIGAGVDARALGNQMNGAYFHGGSIGSLAAPFGQQGAAGPRVANNAGAGVLIADGALVDVTGPILNNGGLGIDIAPVGPNTNDAGDADGGPNESLNAPVISSAVASVASPSTRIQGSFSTRPNSSVEVWLFANPTCNASGFGEAARFLGSVNGLTAAADGTASFDKDFAFSLDRNAFPYVVAMARRFAEGAAALPSPLEVSEFSACFAVTGGAPLPTLSVNDASVTEGNAGTATATFTVSLSVAAAGPVTVGYSTADGTATAGTDYSAASGTLTFTAGQTTKTVAVSVTGDSGVEPNETFALNISGPAGATIVDGSGEGTIVNDDVPPLPTLSIGNVNVTEGNAGTTTATFTVTLSAAAVGAVSVNYATSNGTASSGSDYLAGSGTLSFAAGETSKTVDVAVNGDTAVEPDETFTVTLNAATGATIAVASGQGTITNDDVAPAPPAPGGGGGGAIDWELLAMLASCLLVARLRGNLTPDMRLIIRTKQNSTR